MEAIDTWIEWRNHVLKELERHDSCLVHIDEELKKVSIEIAMLKVKASLWGMAGGSLPVVAAIIYKLLTMKP